MPSMPKGETVGNVVIDGKGDGNGGAPEIETRKREKQSRREKKQQRGSRGSKKRSKEQHQSRSRGSKGSELKQRTIQGAE